MDEDVRNWLKSFGLQEYVKTFEEDGWETREDLFEIDADNLKSCMPKPGHRKRFELALQKTKNPGKRYGSPIKIDNETNKDYNSRDDGASDGPKTSVVGIWLQRHGLEQYVLNFEAEGWDMLEVITHMNDYDVQKCIDKPGHRMKFQIALEKHGIEIDSDLYASAMQDSAEEQHMVESWLKENNLHQYVDKLNNDGWDTFECLLELGRHEEALKRCIDKPGHRKRFQRALERKRSSEKNTLQGEARSVQETTERETEKENIAYSETGISDLTKAQNVEKKPTINVGDTAFTGDIAGVGETAALTDLSRSKTDDTGIRYV